MSELWLPSSGKPAAKPSLRFCECCRRRPGESSVTFIRGGDLHGKHIPTKAVKNVVLCTDCRQGDDYGGGNIPARRHSGGFCTLCGVGAGVIWHCQMIAHVSDKHPSLLEKIVRDPYDDIAAVPQPEYLGRVEVETRDADHPKRIY